MRRVLIYSLIYLWAALNYSVDSFFEVFDKAFNYLISYQFYFLFNLLWVRPKSFGMVRILWRFRKLYIIPDPRTTHTVVTNKFTGQLMWEFITLDIKMPYKHRITALLHEIGHHMDFDFGMANRAIKLKEKRAWRCAIELAEQYNIDMDYRQAEQWLGTYGAKSAHLKNR